MTATSDTRSATQTVDLAIIGSGSGNSIPDDRFADKQIAIFEEGIYGGTCLNVGCIPTKMFVYPAEVADIASDGDRFGVHSRVDGVDWPAIRDRVFGRIDPISTGGLQYRELECENITVYASHVEFDGRDDDGLYRLVTADALVLAREVVIAAGSRPVIPAGIAESGVTYHTNNDVMRLPDLPRRMIILGSGYIAAEFAHVFGSLGTQVTILARGPRLLRKLDTELSTRFTDIASGKWDVRLERDLVSAENLADGGIRLTLGDDEIVEADVLLVATGRVSNGDRLGIDTIGLDLTDDGRVEVDSHGRTGARGVWALGDVSSPFQLKHVANHEERVVADNLLKGWDATDLDTFQHDVVPAAVFTHPQVAAVGLTEFEARDGGHNIAVKVQEFGDVAYGWAMEDTTGACKVIADRETHRLLGVHIIGPQAPTLIQPAIQAMSFGLGVEEMARGQYWIHPAMPEVLENALLGLEF
ncbi:mycothione reductase [Gordonia sp. 852002-50816_SCH5313054-c]|uniref:mycothione reductase n=1 Tax=unclassified Gordonia (in: high G+C Gram-positive bacteria) TaxID=2657482 RepID=UPI0007EC1717|nr:MULTISPECIES: mycothione reductase [unclassified Gordonia (in: high G+C Gram-positive bacteria)]OBC12937.1 mycothione reductase [Gordonia sp. 852002-50816_SCH5313054-a]OBC18846.1 mycothione reductase [Gordonia sp. 852002-50816_SCH5313054-c]